MREVRVNGKKVLFSNPKKKVPVEGDYHESDREWLSHRIEFGSDYASWREIWVAFEVVLLFQVGFDEFGSGKSKVEASGRDST